MIEQGIAQLIQANAAVLALCPAGGFFSEVPKGQALPTWSYSTISEKCDYTLKGPVALTMRRVQIDCYGNTDVEAITLAAAVDAVLSGYRGTLTDPDATVVQGMFRSNKMDFFDDAGRTYRRMLEYELWFNQP